MKIKFPRCFALIAIALGSFTLTSSQAALIAEQEYNGATFGFNGNSFDTGTAVAGLTYPGLLTSGSARSLNTSPQNGFTGGPLSSSSNYFISFLLDTSTNLSGRVGLTLFSVANGPGGGTEIAELGQNNGVINILKGTYASPGFADIPSAIATTAGTHLFVIGVSNSSTTLSLYFDPTPGVLPGSALLTLNTVSAFSLNNMRAFGAGTWDEFRVGDTFADVTPLAVPEPSSVVLASLGLATVLWRRRARKA